MGGGNVLFDAGGVGERCPFASSRWLRGPASDRPRSGGRDEDRKQLSEYETNRGRAGEGEQNVSAASRAKGRIGLRTYTAASGQGMPLRRTFGHTGRPRRVCLFVCVCAFGPGSPKLAEHPRSFPCKCGRGVG